MSGTYPEPCGARSLVPLTFPLFSAHLRHQKMPSTAELDRFGNTDQQLLIVQWLVSLC